MLKEHLTDPIRNASNLDDAAAIAQKQIDALSIELQSIKAEDIAKFKKLLAVGTDIAVISSLSGFTVTAIKKSIGVV